MLQRNYLRCSLTQTEVNQGTHCNRLFKISFKILRNLLSGPETLSLKEYTCFVSSGKLNYTRVYARTIFELKVESLFHLLASLNHKRAVLKSLTPYFTLIVAILSNQPFNTHFSKLSYTYCLATPKRFDAQGVILREPTI